MRVVGRDVIVCFDLFGLTTRVDDHIERFAVASFAITLDIKLLNVRAKPVWIAQGLREEIPVLIRELIIIEKIATELGWDPSYIAHCLCSDL